MDRKRRELNELKQNYDYLHQEFEKLVRKSRADELELKNVSTQLENANENVKVVEPSLVTCPKEVKEVKQKKRKYLMHLS